MAMREFLVIDGGLSPKQQPRDDDPFAVRVLPLSLDVLAEFVVIHTLPCPEPVPHPLIASRTVAIMPDGRYVLAEVSGSAGAVIGEPVAVTEAVEIAQRVLRATGDGGPLDAHSLAVALLGLLATHGNTVGIVWPQARSGA